MSQELIFQASMLERQAQELQEKLNFVNQQISDLDLFSKNLSHFQETNQDDILSSLGKGVFISAKLKDKKLFVDVGSGIIVRKSPKEAQKVIENQLKTFTDVKINLEAKFEEIHIKLQNLMNKLEENKPLQ